MKKNDKLMIKFNREENKIQEINYYGKYYTNLQRVVVFSGPNCIEVESILDKLYEHCLNKVILQNVIYLNPLIYNKYTYFTLFEELIEKFENKIRSDTYNIIQTYGFENNLNIILDNKGNELIKKLEINLSIREKEKEKIYNKIDSFKLIINLHLTHKHLSHNYEKIEFINKNNELINDIDIYDNLTFSEIHYLNIMLTVFLAPEKSIFILHLPETGLHNDIQNKMITNILKINPSSQIIIFTQSPFIISHGWASEGVVKQVII